MDKDWTGNKQTTFAQLGASNHFDGEREINDFYATDPESLQLFLNAIKNDFKISPFIWECACGQGHLSEKLKQNGYIVRSTDLIDRGYGVSGIDFLKYPFMWYGDILTNPPYKYALEFVEQALDLIYSKHLVIMYLKIQFLEGQKRKSFFKKNPPKYVYINSARQLCYLNGDISNKISSATCYCWFIWEKGYKGETIVRWI